MDKKKLIGTVIGIIMFAVLIAGATFAWLTIAATTTNGNYTASTKNFIINYSGGSQITNTVMTDNATTANITSQTTAAGSTDDGWLAVTASKTANSAKAKEFSIKLHVNSNTLTTNAVVWALCKGTCPTTVALATVSSGSATCGSGVTACGTITAGASNTDILLYSDTSTFNTDSAVSETTYNVYVWLDAATIVQADMGKIFSGYIHASATQGD